MTKEIRNNDGSTDIIMITSDDNLDIKINNNYKLANRSSNKIYSKFRNSVLGYDIGVASSGFVNVILLSTVIAISLIAILYFNFRV